MDSAETSRFLLRPSTSRPGQSPLDSYSPQAPYASRRAKSQPFATALHRQLHSPGLLQRRTDRESGTQRPRSIVMAHAKWCRGVCLAADFAVGKAWNARCCTYVASCSRGLRNPCRGMRGFRSRRGCGNFHDLHNCMCLFGSGAWLGVSRRRGLGLWCTYWKLASVSSDEAGNKVADLLNPALAGRGLVYD
jgi:hypothetical protein